MKSDTIISRFLIWFLEKMVLFKLKEGYYGDIIEEYNSRREEKGGFKACWWLYCQVMGAVPSLIKYYVSWTIIMLHNYLKIAFRNIRKQKMYSLLNITGLSVGIAVAVLIIFHVKDELRYDRHFPKSGRIYRIIDGGGSESQARPWACIAPLFGKMVKEEIPEIEDMIRFFYMKSTILSYSSDTKRIKTFEETGGFFADPGAIRMFNLAFISGNPRHALKEPDSIILTASMATKYFGEENPLGKTLQSDYSRPWKVTAVVENLPAHTHLKFDYLVSMSTFQKSWGKMLEHRSWNAFYTYVTLDKNATREQVEEKLIDFAVRFHPDLDSREEAIKKANYYLQPIIDIHLHSHLEKEFAPNSHIAYVYIFSILALFILLIAAVNFVNMTTAQAFKRIKEVGIRKALGARKRQLIFQFIFEAFLLSFAAAVSAALLLKIFMPVYNSLSGKILEFQHLMSLDHIIMYIAAFILLSTLSGIYPAFFMASFKPVSSLKGLKVPGTGATKIRNRLVVFQFVLSVIMIFSTLTIHKQMEYFNRKNLGFDKDQLLAIKLYGDLRKKLFKDPEALKNELMSYTGIDSVTAVSKLPGERLGRESFRPVGLSNGEELPNFRFMRADQDFIESMKLAMVAGKSFSGLNPDRIAFIINESAAQLLNLKHPVGKTAVNDGRKKGKIIGIVKDFHFASLHHPVEPMVITFNPKRARYLLVKIKGDQIYETMGYIRSCFKRISPGYPLIYRFVDDYLERLYASEKLVGRIFTYFSILAIFIACLGLFGLSVYSAEIRIKEVGIRKVLGASSANIVRLFTSGFIKMVLLANLIAWPIAYAAMSKWLEAFAYRAEISINIFILSCVFSLVISLFTVSFQGFKAARANPVESLKYE